MPPATEMVTATGWTWRRRSSRRTPSAPRPRLRPPRPPPGSILQPLWPTVHGFTGAGYWTVPGGRPRLRVLEAWRAAAPPQQVADPDQDHDRADGAQPADHVVDGAH